VLSGEFDKADRIIVATSLQMVFHGGYSKGCQTCRNRRIKVIVLYLLPSRFDHMETRTTKSLTLLHLAIV